MSTKQIKGVIVPRHDTAINWAQAKSFIPRDGELIIYSKDSDADAIRGYYVDEYGMPITSVLIDGQFYDVLPSDVTRFKFGNGIDNVNVLPFVTDSIKDYVDSQSLCRTEQVDAQQAMISAPNTKLNVAVKLRPTHNLYNFDDTVVPKVSNRIYTSEFLKPSDFTSITLTSSSFVAKCYLYNSNYALIDSTGDFQRGPITVPTSRFGNASYFRVILGHESAIAPDAGALYVDFELSDASTLEGQWNATPIMFNQGTIDQGKIYNVTTRIHSERISIDDYRAMVVPQGFKAAVHFYSSDSDTAWLAKAPFDGWISQGTTITVNSAKQIPPSAKFFSIVLANSVDDTSNISTIDYLDIDCELPFMRVDKWEQGTLDRSVVTRLIHNDDANGVGLSATRNGVTLTNLGDGRFLMNGTVTGTGLSLNANLTPMLTAIQSQYSNARQLICALQAVTNNGYGESLHLKWSAIAADSKTPLTSDDGGVLRIELNDWSDASNLSRIPAYISVTIPAGVSFNNVVCSLQLEKGTELHPWEEGRQDTGVVTIMADMANQVEISDVPNDGVAQDAVTVTDSGFAIMVTKGCRIESVTYGAFMTLDDFNKHIATSTSVGVIKTNTTYGLAVSDTGNLVVQKASDADITAKTHTYKPIVPANLDLAVKTSVTSNTKTLTSSEKTKACSWLGAAKTSDLAALQTAMNNRIYINESAPTNPVEGMIWIQPIDMTV